MTVLGSTPALLAIAPVGQSPWFHSRTTRFSMAGPVLAVMAASLTFYAEIEMAPAAIVIEAAVTDDPRVRFMPLTPPETRLHVEANPCAVDADCVVNVCEEEFV